MFSLSVVETVVMRKAHGHLIWKSKQKVVKNRCLLSKIAVFLAEHYNLYISNFRLAILTSRPTAHLGRAAFAAFERFAAGKSSADCARRRVSERNRREAAALGAEMGGFAALSIKTPKGVAAFGRRNPKRKDILSDVLSFWWTIQGSDL